MIAREVSALPSLSRVESPVRTFDDAAKFFFDHAEDIDRAVQNGRGFVFSGFPVKTAGEFGRLLKIVNPNFLPYTGAKVRQSSEGFEHLYRPTSTPRFRKNFLHNEMAYQRDVPPKIAFFCELPSPVGGESLLGDQRRVLESLKPEFRARLLARKLKFVRCLANETKVQNFLRTRLDALAIFPSWQMNFETRDRSSVEATCRARGFDVEWTAGGDLVLSVVIDPVKPHPATGEPMWVNNAHLFQLHKSVYGPGLYYAFKTASRLINKPLTLCYYGDGAPIEPEVVDDILRATEENEFKIGLQAGEFIYAHNWTLSHGRTAFEGLRKVYFGLLH
ncbi:MAG TPA: TauD/TfdA family dioxygenase [Bdellovibrionales bacterium]|nr:TauD/TfdA family dioxygenase [Bdellovibrionales bacterium]